MKNTKLEYMYRDGANYKMFAEAVLPGTLSPAETAEILKQTRDEIFPDCHYFYPGNIGLPAPTCASEGYDAYDDDPDWHELLNLSATDEEPTTEITAEALLSAVRNGSATRNN